MNAEGLPRFMRGLPKEMKANQLTAAQAGYIAEVETVKPVAAPGWPRLAGHFDVLLPRCVMHTHTDLPMNATLTSYFDLDGGASPKLMDKNGKQSSDAGDLVKFVMKLQASGCVQVKWTVNHVNRPHWTAAVTDKVEQLAKHRPVTFDLARKYVPPAQYRNGRKRYEDRPAQAEGNSTWWNAVRCMQCKPGPTATTPATSGRAVPDAQIRNACDQHEVCRHSKDNCCWMRAEIHFERKITQGQYSYNKKEVKELMRILVKNDFRPDAVTPAAELADASPFAGLKTNADTLLAAGSHKEAISAYTKALEVPVRQRHKDAAADRKLCVVGRAKARLAIGDAEGAEDDCTIALSDDTKCAQALHQYGCVLVHVKKMQAASAAFRCALVEDPDNAEYLASLDAVKSAVGGGAAAAAAALGSPSTQSGKLGCGAAINKVLKQIHPDMDAISAGGLDWLDCGLSHFLEGIVHESSPIASVEDLKARIRSKLPDALCRHALDEVGRCVIRYEAGQDRLEIKAGSIQAVYPTFSTKLCTALAGLVEYLCAEILELGGNQLRKTEDWPLLARFGIDHMKEAITQDDELAAAFPSLDFHALLAVKPVHAASASASAAAAKSPKPSQKKMTVTVSNALEKPVELYVVGSQQEMEAVAPQPGSIRFTDKTQCVVKYDRVLTDSGGYRGGSSNAAAWRYGGYNRGTYHPPKYDTASEAKKSLGITFKPKSSPPEILSIAPGSL